MVKNLYNFKRDKSIDEGYVFFRFIISLLPRNAKQGKDTVFLTIEKTDALCKKNAGTIFSKEICPILLQLESVLMKKKHSIVPSDMGTLRGVLTGIGRDDPTIKATAVKTLGNDKEESKEIDLDEFKLNGFAGYINPAVEKDDGVYCVSNPMLKKSSALANLLSSSFEILEKNVKDSGQACFFRA